MTQRDQNADFCSKPQIFADSPLLLEIQTFGGRRKPQNTADVCREPKIYAGNRRLGSVTLGASPLARPYQNQLETVCANSLLRLFLARFLNSYFNQEKFDHDKGQNSAISGRRLHWIFCFFSSVYVQFSKTSPTKSGESSEKSSGENRVKSCHVCGCHGFFGPDLKEGERTICTNSSEKFSCKLVLLGWMF